MTPLEEQVQKNTTSIKTISDSLIEYAKCTDLNKSNDNISDNTSDIEQLRTNIGNLQTQINLQNRIEQMKDTNIVDATKLDLLQYDGKRWSNIAANKVVTGLLGKLVDLQDVSINDLRNDNALAWDSELQKWTNKNLNTEIYDDVFLSKIKPDSTAYEVWFKESAIFGQEGFASGLTGFGGKIDKFGHAEFDSLTLRRFLEVPELRYNRVEIQLGDKWNAPGAGVIESVEVLDQYTGTITLKLEEGEYGAISIGDLCMGIYHSERTEENAENDEDDGRGNRKFAGFYTVYFEVTNILDAQNKQFGYKLRPVDEYWTMTYHPCAQMNFVAYGNKTNVDRQTSCYSTRTYTRYLVNQDTWDQKAKNIAMQFGNLDNLNMFGYDMRGYSAYLNSVYFTGTITQVKPNGEEIRYANDRGPWEPDTHYDYYDRVSVLGYLWLCVNINGTDTKPSDSNPDWLMQVSKGDTGEGLIVRRSEWWPGRLYCNESEVSPTVQPLRYLDVVLVKDLGASTGYKAYKCISTIDRGQGQGKHLSSSDNQPGTAGGAEYWEELAQNVASIYTDLIVAKNAKLDFITGNSLRVGYQVDNTPNGFRVVAGITGEGGSDSNSIRIWAGSDEENRSSAPFKVTQSGALYSTKGQIGGFNIGSTYLENKDSSTGDGLYLDRNSIIFKKEGNVFAVGNISTLGTNILGIITKTNSSIDRKLPNFGLAFDVYGSDISNIAIGGNGDVVMNGLVQGFGYDVKSYTANNTIYEINFDSEVVILRTAGTTGSFVNLPSKRNVTSRLGITEGSAFCAEITFVADVGITETRVYGRHGKATDFGGTEFPQLYDSNGNKIDYVTMNQGDIVTILIIHEPFALTERKYYARLKSFKFN